MDPKHTGFVEFTYFQQMEKEINNQPTNQEDEPQILTKQ